MNRRSSRKSRRKSPRKSSYADIARWFRYVNAVVLLGVTVFVAAWAGGLVGLRTAFQGERQLVDYRPRLTTQIYSTERHPDGEATHTLIGQVYKENRELVPLREIPRELQQATIAIEDHRFWKHRGISPRDMLRAAWINLRGGTVRQGASTLTQQLVRNIWLSHERTWDRKLKEILLAIEVERRFSKQEILEMYLNEVYYGHGAYGIGTAARTLYGKEPAELTLGEVTLLTGLPRAPAYYSPFNHPDRAKKRRQEVLAAMQRQGYIGPQQAKEADEEQIQSRLQPQAKEAGIVARHAPHFTHLVIRMLCQQYGVDRVYEGGWRVYTTLDKRVQEIAEDELTKRVEWLRGQRRIKGNLVGQGALACVDVHTGDVLAMVGGVGPYEEVQYNRAHPGPPRYGRQPGSSFKPYVWATGLESGYAPNSVFSADPLAIRVGRDIWQPRNYSAGQSGNYTLRGALAASVNLVSVRLLQKVGAKTVVGYAARILDIPEQRLAEVPALALGVSNLSPLEQASGYACFASGGLRAQRRFVTRIENHRGEVIVDNSPQVARVLPPATAISMTKMLRGVVTGGTGRRAHISGVTACGKTGTTQDGRDAWWVGFTPDLSAAVWIGNDDNDPMRRSSGGYFCAPVWQKFMKRVIEMLQCSGKFPEGKGVVATRPSEPGEEEEEEEDEGVVRPICTASGRRATAYCPQTVDEFFAAGEDLPGPCTLHRKLATPDSSRPGDSDEQPGPPPERTIRVTICQDSGKLATLFCPQTREIEVAVGSAPTGSCDLHTPPLPPPKPTAPSGAGPGERPEAEPGDQPVIEPTRRDDSVREMP